MNKLLWALPLMLLACSDVVEWREPTQVMVRIDSDTTSFDELSVAVFAKQASGWAAVSDKTFLRDDVQWPHDVAIVPAVGSGRDHMFEVVVQLKGKNGPLAKQRKLTTFVAHQQRVLSFDLWTGACQGASPICEPNDRCHGDECATCVEGSCVATPFEEELPRLVIGPGPVVDGGPRDAVVDAIDAVVDAAPVVDPCMALGCTGSCEKEEGSARCACAELETLAADGKTCRTQSWGGTQTLSTISGSYISVAMNANGTAYAAWNEPDSTSGLTLDGLRGTLCTDYTCDKPSQLGAGGEHNQGLFAHVSTDGAVSWTGEYSSAGLITIKGRRAPSFAEQTIGSYTPGSIAWFHRGATAPYVMYYGDSGLHSFVGKPDGTWSAFPVYQDHFGEHGSFVAFDDGTLVTAWGEDPGTYWMSRLAGGVWGPALKLGDYKAALKPTRTVLDASGVVHIFFAVEGTLHHTRVAKDGTQLSSDQFDLPYGGGVANFYASAGKDNVAVSWDSSTTVGVSTWSASKGWKTKALNQLAAGNPNGTPLLALSRNDRTVQVVWGLTQPGAKKNFVFAQSNDLGVSWPFSTVVIESETPSQDLATDGEGHLMLTWSELASADGTGATRVRFFR